MELGYYYLALSPRDKAFENFLHLLRKVGFVRLSCNISKRRSLIFVVKGSGESLDIVVASSGSGMPVPVPMVLRKVLGTVCTVHGSPTHLQMVLSYETFCIK